MERVHKNEIVKHIQNQGYNLNDFEIIEGHDTKVSGAIIGNIGGNGGSIDLTTKSQIPTVTIKFKSLDFYFKIIPPFQHELFYKFSHSRFGLDTPYVLDHLPSFKDVMTMFQQWLFTELKNAVDNLEAPDLWEINKIFDIAVSNYNFENKEYFSDEERLKLKENLIKTKETIIQDQNLNLSETQQRLIEGCFKYCSENLDNPKQDKLAYYLFFASCIYSTLNNLFVDSSQKQAIINIIKLGMGSISHLLVN